jgi:hypothetical protein
MTYKELRAESLLSMQRALWNEVTPDLRGVAMGWDNGVVVARFLYDSPVDDQKRERLSDVEVEVIADLEHDTTTNFEVEYLPIVVSRQSRALETWAYLRAEDN